MFTRTVSSTGLPEDRAARVRGEVIRVASAFGLYLIARPLWSWTGLEGLYREGVLRVARLLFLPNQHFPVVLTIDPANASNLDFVVVFTICLLAVTTSMGWKQRLKWLGLVLPVLFAVHVASTILRVRLASAAVLEEQFGLTVLLPWEHYLVDTTSYLIYDLGLQLWPFVLLVSTSPWFRETRVGRQRVARRAGVAAIGKTWWVTVGVLAAVALAFEGAGRVREGDPRHVATHAAAGHRFLEAGNEPAAREHYEAAVAGQTTDAEAYYNLSDLMRPGGEPDLAERTLRDGERTCDSPACRQRFADAIARANRSR